MEEERKEDGKENKSKIHKNNQLENTYATLVKRTIQFTKQKLRFSRKIGNLNFYLSPNFHMLANNSVSVLI